MAQFRISSRTFAEFRDERRPGQEGVSYWDDLSDRVGPALPFIVRSEAIAAIPFEEINLPRMKAGELRPKPGEMWVLFCLLGGETDASTDSPIRADGFPIVLEWRKDTSDSPLLSSAFHALASLVRQQQGVEGWGLCPAYSRYGDNVDFTDPILFADHKDALYVASAYGALAAGLVCATTGKHPSSWPFPTMQWDENHHDLVGVMGLAQKFSVAADFGARIVTVAQEQAESAKKTLQTLRQGTDGHRFGGLRICAVSGRGKPAETARRIAYVESKIVRTRCAVAALLALVLLNVGGLAYWLDWQSEKIAYFSGCVDRFGVFEGLGPLNRSQLAGRGQSYRFHYQGYDSFVPGRRKPVVQKVCCVNAFDHVRQEERNPLPHLLPAAGREFVYSKDGALLAVRNLEADGTLKEICRIGGREAEIVDIVRRGADGRLGTASRVIAGGLQPGLDEIGRYRIRRNKDGFVVRVESFRKGQDVPVPDKHGVFRTDYRVDGLGRVIGETYYSWDGQPVSREDDDERMFAYDDGGNVIEIRHLKGGKVVWREMRAYDNHGNCVQVKKASLDSDHPILGWSEQKIAYDEHGERTLVEHYGSDGKLAKLTDARWIRRPMFANGHLTGDDVSFFDWRNEPGADGHVFRRESRYDENMRRIEIRRYGKNGQLLVGGEVAALETWKYDAEGRELENETANGDGTPWCGTRGYSRRVHDFVIGKDGIAKTTRYYASKDIPVCEVVTGAAVEKMEYDLHGRIRRISLYDEKGEATLGSNGWHRVTFRHDQHGFFEGVAYFGKKDEPVLAHGFSSFEYDVGSFRQINDEAGRAIETSLLGCDGKLMNGDDGWATVKRTYDKAGRRTEESLFDAEGNAVEPRGGANCRTRYIYGENGKLARKVVYSLNGSYRVLEYDWQGREMKDAAFSSGGAPIDDENGVHAVLYKRDKLGRVVKKGFLNAKGKPTLNEERMAGLSTKYDEQGSVCENVRFGVDGELVRDINGVCIVRWQFDERHRDAGRTFYDEHTNRVANADGVFEVRKFYDSAGYKTEEYDVGVDGRARPDSYGVCIAHSDFDNSGRVVRKTFYDADRHPVQSTESIGGWLSEYEDNTSHETKRLFFGTDGKPCLNSEGSAGWKQEFDSRGNVIKSVCIGLDGLPILNSEGIAGWIKQYDGRNRCAVEKYLDADGKSICARRMFDAHLMCTVDVERVEFSYEANGMKTLCWMLARGCKGVDRIVQVHDALEDLIEVRFENASRQLVALPLGFAKEKNKYNTFHELVLREWYDAAGRRCCRHGVYKFVVEYDRTGNGLRQTIHNYDKNGFSVADETGAAFAEQRYDGAYRFLSGKTLDAKGNPIAMKELGCAEIALTRDGEGRVTRAEAFDEKGKGAFDGFAGLEMSYSTTEDGSLLVSVTPFDSNGVKQETKANVPYSSKEMTWLQNLSGRRYQRLR